MQDMCEMYTNRSILRLLLSLTAFYNGYIVWVKRIQIISDLLL